MADTAPTLRLGGMALQNGLIVHGPTHWAAAVRARDGEILVASGRKPRLPGPVERVPGARGVIRLAEAIAVIPLVMRALPAARLPFQSGPVAAAALGAALSGARMRRRSPGMGGELGAIAVSLLPSVIALSHGETAAYHGVEHKSIAAYEQGADDARDAAKEHDRCGSHLIAPLFAANLAGTALLRRLSLRASPVAGSAVSLASVAVAVEVFLWAERNSRSAMARALRLPGNELQRLLGTREPSEEQLEVGRAAMTRILLVERPAAL